LTEQRLRARLSGACRQDLAQDLDGIGGLADAKQGLTLEDLHVRVARLRAVQHVQDAQRLTAALLFDQQSAQQLAQRDAVDAMWVILRRNLGQGALQLADGQVDVARFGGNLSG
jgi:hypothetical protein